MGGKKGQFRKLALILIPMLLIVGAGYGLIVTVRPSKPKIGVLEINGTIRGFEYANLAEKARKDSSIKAVVLRINSPGGGVTGSFQTESSVSKLTDKKPVVASLQELAASGAYVVASAADNIYAYEHTITAGLGVIAMWVSYADYFENKGIDYYIWKTGQQKDMFEPWRKPTENEKQYIQNLVESFEKSLFNRITNNRPETKSYVENISDGLTRYGTRALELNLIDNIGTYNDAVDKAADAAGLEKGEYKKVDLSEYFS